MKTPWFYGYSKLLKIQKAIHQSNKKKKYVFVVIINDCFIEIVLFNY